MSILAAESENPLLPPVGEIIIGLIAFGLVLFVMFKFVAPRFEQVFRARREAIEGGIERAEAMQAEAKAALEQYRAQLAEAREEAAQVRNVARGEEQLTTQRQQIVHELRGQIGTLAVDLAGRVVGESLADDARRSGTVDRFLAELDGMSATGDGRGGAHPVAESNR